MNHFYITPESLKQKTAVIDGDDARHLIKSLRAKVGETVQLFDGENHQAIGGIKRIDATPGKERIIFELSDYKESNRENKTISISLFQSVPKGSKLKQIVEKSTELGVNTVVPFYSSRSVSRPGSSDKKKTDRLNETAYQASKQCGRGEIPVVEPFLDFDEAVEKLKHYDTVIVAYEDENKQSLKSVLKNLNINSHHTIALVIGPEGGFDPKEIERLKKTGAEIVSLGPRILRTETAGIAAIAQLNYEFEN